MKRLLLVIAALVASMTVGATAQRVAAAPVPAATCSTTHGTPTAKLFPATVTGLSVSINGVIVLRTGLNLTAINWAWGDGAAIRGHCTYFPGTHTYAKAGTFKVVLTAKESNGAHLSASEKVTVT